MCASKRLVVIAHANFDLALITRVSGRPPDTLSVAAFILYTLGNMYPLAPDFYSTQENSDTVLVASRYLYST